MKIISLITLCFCFTMSNPIFSDNSSAGPAAVETQAAETPATQANATNAPQESAQDKAMEAKADREFLAGKAETISDELSDNKDQSAAGADIEKGAAADMTGQATVTLNPDGTATQVTTMTATATVTKDVPLPEGQTADGLFKLMASAPGLTPQTDSNGNTTYKQTVKGDDGKDQEVTYSMKDGKLQASVENTTTSNETTTISKENIAKMTDADKQRLQDGKLNINLDMNKESGSNTLKGKLQLKALE